MCVSLVVLLIRRGCLSSSTDDASRVKLEAVSDIEGSDYINASYIDVSLFTICVVRCTYMHGHAHVWSYPCRAMSIVTAM